MKLKTKNIVVIGALSAIAQGVANVYAKSGSNFFLVARREGELVDFATQLKGQGAGACSVFVADLRHRDMHADIVSKSVSVLGNIDLVLIAHGVCPERTVVAESVDVTLDSFMVNAVTVISFMHRYGLVLKEQRNGTIAVLSSVAGERGRRNNYHYGSAKAAVTAYASGQRAELADYGVRVVTIKPGPVATPMTTHQNMPLMASVSKVAEDIAEGIELGKTVIFTPWIWRYIMMVIRLLPERLFMKVRR